MEARDLGDGDAASAICSSRSCVAPRQREREGEREREKGQWVWRSDEIRDETDRRRTRSTMSRGHSSQS